MSFFRITNNKLDVDLTYILLYKEFKTIYDSDTTSDKSKAEAVFRYIYERCDYRSYSNRQGLKKAEAHSHALNLAGLDTSFILDKPVTAAMNLYKKLNYNVNAELLSDLKATLALSVKINEKIHKVLDTRLSNPDLPETDIGILINVQKQLFEIIAGLPDRINKVKELEADVYSDLSKPKEIGRGGDVIPDSYEGDPEIEGA